MKVINLFLATSSLVSGTFKFEGDKIINPIDIDNEIFVNFTTDDYYGAFSNDSNSNITLKFSTTTRRHYLYVKYYNYRTNSLLVSESYKLSDYLNSNLTMSYTIKCKGKLNSDGLFIVFSTENTEGTEKTTKSVLLYPTNNDTIYSYQYVNSAYTISNRVFKLVTNGVRSKESVRFENTIDYLTNDSSNAIDISEVTFTYNEGYNLVNKGVNKYLKILDLDYVYPNLTRDVNNYINIPLECVQNGKDISMKYKNHFYYNPSTLDMSFTSRSGYVETDKFYIPKGKLKILENATFTVDMPSFGRSEFNIVIPLNFVKDRNYLGLCGDSSHCIIGGIKE